MISLRLRCSPLISHQGTVCFTSNFSQTCKAENVVTLHFWYPTRKNAVFLQIHTQDVTSRYHPLRWPKAKQVSIRSGEWVLSASQLVAWYQMPWVWPRGATEFKQSSSPGSIIRERETTNPTWVWLRKTRLPSRHSGPRSPRLWILLEAKLWAGKAV